MRFDADQSVSVEEGGGGVSGAIGVRVRLAVVEAGRILLLPHFDTDATRRVLMRDTMLGATHYGEGECSRAAAAGRRRM